ncbi:MAG: hypothetical protein UY17_C0040G0003 [Candidatus Beckwithbacteria bacterium GW2011_GWC2_47_9]|uniref:Polymerase beta nucleotidyltransferase domain-containing protein n=3 Tax=Candidatus Beckwithiibacteriota TaxID=1752726 RepID=A0A0G1WX04_9BACT|nr:MAG: hypothetical protein UY17_C0040G0003 [Candidatus Beckwithbacteria bacterium GW2011_GWC2_47_9]OGD56498.1 MAG: hypothetical protein A3E73_00020 [Candidatus Beckwithbacteria bacterium RIFCSPHIGHO2_12_FULL_47_17]OGD59172.1 MAG: hypothetical protein A3I57_03495 [Candidatus Beckwithbacteria bacterium RIFCSPLOWO2_02_FULL_47_23]
MGKQKIDRIKKAILPTLKKHDVVRASLFGSLVRGEDTAASDIDLLIQFKGRKSLLDLVGLELALKDQLNQDVDVLTFASINHLIRDRVLKEQVPIL